MDSPAAAPLKDDRLGRPRSPSPDTMAALDSSGSHQSRELAPQTLDQLREALIARLRADLDAETRLGAALRAAAAEARACGLRPEELIITLKSIGQQAEYTDGTAILSLAERRRILEQMVPAILKAYFE